MTLKSVLYADHTELARMFPSFTPANDLSVSLAVARFLCRRRHA